MKYEKYQHICKLNDSETEDILNGTVYIFSKLDGSNATMYLNDDGELKVGSRNRALTLIEDNQGCMAYVVSQPKFEQYLRKHPNHRLFGEWLIKNSIKDYEDDAWRHIYIFDVIEYDEEGKMRYLSYEEYVPLLEEFDIKYIPLLAKLDNPTEEEVQEYVDKCTYLMKDNKPGEGCFGRNTRILMADGTYKKIVDVKIGDYVKSYNVETKEVENKKVINVFDNGVKPFKEWYNVTVNNKRLNTVDKAFNITKTHKIFNGDSFVPIENTQIAYMYEKVPDDYRKQAILGILCSDGCYHKAKGRDTISISQAKTKANAWINVLGDFITNSYVHISGKGSEICRYNIKQKYIDFILKDYKINDTLNFVKIFQSLDDVGWAYVFMGDGSGGDYAETDICIASYTNEEAKNILVHFNKYFNTDAYLRFDKRVKNGSGASIRLRKADSIKFINRIGKYILEEYRYKIRHFDNIIFEEVPIYNDTYKLIPKTIYSKKEEIDMYRAKSGNYDGIHAYDLEVEDNHNYFAENMLVHNCVMKNYNYHNAYGRITWAKIVRSAFKIAHKAKLPMDVDSIEEKITNDLCTPELIEKEYNKILNDNGGKWDSKCIPKFLGIFWHTFITEECFNMIKKYKEPTINFRTLHKFVIDKIKETKSELF